MKPTFLLWMRQIGYFPVFLLADISIAALAVSFSFLLWGTIKPLELFAMYAIFALSEYAIAYVIYRMKHPTPSGVFYLGTETHERISISAEDMEEHVRSFGQPKIGRTEGLSTISNNGSDNEA